MSGPHNRLEHIFETSARARYAGAVGLFLGGVALRLVLDPILSGSLGMAVFYPAVILSAYWMGARPAALTAVLSTGAVLAFQSASAGSIALTPVSWVIIGLFVGASALIIYLMSSIRARLSQVAEQSARAEALTLSQAGLFRDHAERVTNHLQLIAAILEFRAEGEDKPDAARLLTNAASRTLLISRMHREFAGGQVRTVDFAAFARRLAQASDPGRAVEVRGDGLHLPPEQATGLGLVLLDRLNASSGPVAVDVAGDGDEIAFTLAVEEPGLPASAREMMLLDAVALQLRARLDIQRDGDLSILRLIFSEGLQPPPAWAPLEQVVH